MNVSKRNVHLYNIFVTANILSANPPEEELSRLFSLIGQPARIQILLVIADQEACVCHLEAVTGMRQASISQHLMVLRKARLVTPNRAGRNIFYRLARPEVIQVLRHAAQLAGFAPDMLNSQAVRPISGCPCPQCNPDMDPKLTCKELGAESTAAKSGASISRGNPA
jgi:DNA-binding transcriptional ArsR family regulator